MNLTLFIRALITTGQNISLLRTLYDEKHTHFICSQYVNVENSYN